MNNIDKPFNGILNSSGIELLKWFALMAMTVDHIYKFWGLEMSFVPFVIGRTSFALFAFILAYNYHYNTKNKDLYLQRLLSFGILAQVAYGLMGFGLLPFEENFRANIFITMFFGLGLYHYFLRLKEEERSGKISFTTVSIFAVILFSSIVINVDYSYFGILFIISLLAGELFFAGVLFFLMNMVVMHDTLWQYVWLVLALFLVLFLVDKFGKTNIKVARINRTFFYLYYPLHLIAIGLLAPFVKNLF